MKEGVGLLAFTGNRLQEYSYVGDLLDLVLITSSLTCWGFLEFRFDDGALNKIFACFVEHHQASISSSAF